MAGLAADSPTASDGTTPGHSAGLRAGRVVESRVRRAQQAGLCGDFAGFADDPLLLCLRIKFAMDSLLEGAGFEPSVPGSRERGPPIVREQVANRFPGP